MQRHLLRLIVLAATLLFAAAAHAQPNTLSDPEKADGWALLFDGKTLDGWTTIGDLAAWTVAQDKDGPVITMANPGHGEWLRTKKMYRDFELLVDFDVEKGKNSGVGLRGSSVGDPAFTGMEIQVFGNQGEKPTITCCGAVYDACTPDCSDAPGGILPLKDGGQWNTYHIKLVGDTINIWLNGVHIQKDQKLDGRGYTHRPEAKNPLNSRCKTGFIALQDHGDKVRFRNLKIKDLSVDKDPVGFEPIFDGKSTNGWTTKGTEGNGKWRIEDGVLIGNDVGLQSEQEFKAVEIRTFMRCTPGTDATFGFSNGHQIHWKAGDGNWNDFRLRLADGKCDMWVNGQHSGMSTSAAEGAAHVLLAAKGGDVMFKDVQVREVGKE